MVDLEVGNGDERSGPTKHGPQRPDLGAANPVSDAGGVPATVKRHDVWDIGAARGRHGRGRDKGVVALNMDDVGVGRPNTSEELSGEEQVSGLQACRDPSNGHAVENIDGRQIAADVDGEDRDVDAGTGESPGHLADVGLHAAHERRDARGHLEDAQGRGTHESITPRTVSVVIGAYTERRWDDLVAAVGSVECQTHPALEIIVAVDRNLGLLERIRASLPGVIAVENTRHDGAGGARNSGVAIARGTIVAFIDDDVIADERWIEHLVRPFEEPSILGAGGEIRPRWLAGRPCWFPEEFDWVVGCTYRGMPLAAAPVRNLIAANMAVRREVFDALDGFRVDFGKVGARSSPEETDFCIRALLRWPERNWIYYPSAAVHHTVPAERGEWRYFLRRCWYEGLGKGELAGLVGDRSGLSSEMDYTLKVLPSGALRGLAGALRGRLHEALKSAAIVTGFAVVLAGFVRARIAR